METHEVRCKRRISFAYGGHQTASVARRNARERNRVKQVNNGFATLRAHIPVSVAAALGGQSQSQRPAPGSAASKKLSKVETLRLAVEYIRSLQQLLDGGHVTSTQLLDSHMNSTQLLDSHMTSTPPPSNSPPASVPSPRCSDASSSPPPSSYNSDSAPSQPTFHHYHHHQPMSPEDEELLDVISWWQQTQ